MTSYTETVTNPTEENAIQIQATVLPAVGYGLWQDGVTPVQAVTVTNDGEEMLDNLQLQITALPEFAQSATHSIGSLEPHRSITLTRPMVALKDGYLANLDNPVAGVLQFTLCRQEEPIAQMESQLQVLPFGQWQGLSLYPELFASWVVPGVAPVMELVARAGLNMEDLTGSMDGYLSQDSQHVLRQAEAVYATLQALNLTQKPEPESLYALGVPVTFAADILRQQASCQLEATLLYAACLERAGLNPLLITAGNRLFAGLWLEERMFPETVQDDASLITRRLSGGTGELAVISLEGIFPENPLTFNQAQAAGEALLAQVEYIIDIRRARAGHILPLPERVQTPAGWTVRHTAVESENRQAEEKEIPKKLQWERKLLDLGLRNTLINLRFTKSQLPLLVHSLDVLENTLTEGYNFTILPKPAQWQMELSFENLCQFSGAATVAAEFENKHLHSVYPPGELNNLIKGLYRSAKAAIEENGANTLYLALGMLRWYENKRSTKARYAPIILLPVEMVRKNANQGYVIRIRDDEPQMNITLLEKLKQDFSITVEGVDPLPSDEHGIDIRQVMTQLRRAILGQPDWEILESACLGIFSFSQFVMWNDIRNRTEDLMRNKIVRSLIDGKLAWNARPMEMGDVVSEQDVLLPMPADASQLFAIRAASGGESFVLHGPPGTGKSQTITSLIANALARGKRVLFVAEKMAALSVVQNRLENIGIGPFCLELHSNKSKKKDVLEQLRRASEVTKTKTAEAYAAKADSLAAMRKELDDYARQLHTLQKCGRDLYTLINDYEPYKTAPDTEPFEMAYIQSVTGDTLEQNLLILEQLVAAGEATGHPHNHPLRSVGCRQYTQTLREQLKPVADEYINQLQLTIGYVRTLCRTLDQKQPTGFTELQELSRLASRLGCWYGMPAGWTKAENPPAYFADVTKMAKHHQNAAKLEQKLLQQFDAEILNQDGRQLYAAYTQTMDKWFLGKAMGLKKLRKLLNGYAKTPVEKSKLQSHLETLRDYTTESSGAKSYFARYGKDLGTFFRGADTDWEKIIKLAAIAKDSSDALLKHFGSYDVIHTHCGSQELRAATVGLWKGFAAFTAAKAEFDSLLGIIQRRQVNWLDGQLQMCRTILENANGLREWITYVAVAAKCRVMGLTNVVNFYAGGAEHADILPAYHKAILKGLIGNAIDANSALNQFSGSVFNKRIQQYKRMDQEWTEISRQEAYCRLASRVPNFTQEASHSSELGVLQRCIRSGGRGMSIRKLFDQIPNLLPRLAPCMLMSPISAAQYLDPKRTPFDIVVFDEASQLPTCKAVGVLARGRDAVIVGDPKQMPPTSFFATETVNEDNLAEEDLESILDDCLALNMPQSHLLWHYRSRHESLIAYSNSRFYENKLFTFPSVNDRASKVRLVPVEGVFDRGKSRTNRAEAEAVVEELKRRCHDPELSGQSVGVVTFNVSQQNLIDDLLSAACAQDPQLDQWAYHSPEPVFIKNLENVQGDERDVILFSIGYGPDEKGNVYVNFGPLNRDGGWRRLNVAISRARCEMIVFSALRGEMIDLNRTKSEGVAALRGFLEYADGKTAVLEQEAQAQTASGIAEAICQTLNENGYQTDLGVGRSQYRIDIGVVDPQKPDSYLLGIMLDGSSYGAAKTTRDRELAQINVLKGLGWNILRVWSLDWWNDSEKECKRILDTLQQLQEGTLELDMPEPEQPEQTATIIVDTVAPVSDVGAPKYVAAKLPLKQLPAEEFTEPRYVPYIKKRLEQIVATEAPVSAAVVTRRLVQSYGIARAGSRMQSHINSILRSMKLRATVQADTVFYWRADQTPDEYSIFRVSGEAARDVRDVPAHEIANAIYVVLYQQISMAQEDLLREVSKKLGYARVGGNVLSALELGIRYAKYKGCIILAASGTYVLTDSGTARAKAILQTFRQKA